MTTQISFSEFHNLLNLLLRNAKFNLSSLHTKQQSTKVNEDVNRKTPTNHKAVCPGNLSDVHSSNLLSRRFFSRQVQKRFYGKAEADKPVSRVELTIKVPHCAPKKPKLRLPICPPIVKSAGSGPPRLKLAGCEEACVYSRKFCCVRPDRSIDVSQRIKTPYPSFLECMRNAIDIQKTLECSCWDNVQSPCEADARKRFVRPRSGSCK